MTAYVFVGPTLTEKEAASVCDAVCLPPSAQGDVYRVARRQPRAIGLIDGCFHGVPAVWHKEILWAMSQGIHVFGSASMGALRAAELHTFGMRGVGRIFEAFRDGRLEDDDEVAVLHGPAEAGFVQLSEPMVNIRATLERGVRDNGISEAAARALCEAAKALFYQHRTWEKVLHRAAAQGLPAEERASVEQWLATRDRVDQKREDALAMLTAMQELLASDAAPEAVGYRFEWTDVWDEAVGFSSGFTASASDSPATASDQVVMNELRLEPDRFARLQREALLQFLALREAQRRRLDAGHGSTRAKLDEFRLERGLLNRRDVDDWLEQNSVGADELERLMEDAARLESLSAQVQSALFEHVIAGLKIRGDYGRLLDRAQAKQRALQSIGLSDPDPQTIDMVPPRLLAWYFARLGEPVPEALAVFVQQLGLSDEADYYRLLAGEYLYCELENKRQ